MTSTSKKTILVLAANPTNTARLRLDEEFREIESILQSSSERDRFHVQFTPAIRTDDIHGRLLYVKPQILHFSGHGTGADGIAVEDEVGRSHLISTEALARLFELFSSHVECVILNACYSETQARAISQHVNYVIGMNRAIGDRSAIGFSKGFYRALGNGRDYKDAYKLACNALDLKNLTDATVPRLWRKPGLLSPPYLEVPRIPSRPPSADSHSSSSSSRSNSKPSAPSTISTSSSIHRTIQKNWIVFIAIVLCWMLFGASSSVGDIGVVLRAGISGGLTGALWGWARRISNARVQWDQVLLFAMIGIVLSGIIWMFAGKLLLGAGTEIGFACGLILVALLMWDLTQHSQKHH